MTTTQQKTSAPQAVEQTKDLLEQVLEATQHPKGRFIRDELNRQIDQIEELLPPPMKGHGSRLVRRAMLTLSRRPELKDCPANDFVRCVLEAAELGLAIDGKLAYVVRYKSAWQFQADYKALIAVARRNGLIRDCYARTVRARDRFIHGERDGSCYLEHSYALGELRGEVIGCYAKVILPDGRWRYELMDREELDAIQKRAPAQNGPWKTDTNEMRKKTVCRRLLKLYVDDPGFMAAWDEPSWEREIVGAEHDNEPKASSSAPLAKHDNEPKASPIAPPAKVGNEHPGLPKDGRELLDRLHAKEYSLVQKHACQGGDLLAYIQKASMSDGYPEDIEQWPAEAIKATVAWVRKFEHGCTIPANHRANELWEAAKKKGLDDAKVYALIKERGYGKCGDITRAATVPAELCVLDLDDLLACLEALPGREPGVEGNSEEGDTLEI